MNIVDEILKLAGEYAGQGVNHDGEDFTGKLELCPILGGKGVQIAFKASGNDGTVFHEEVSTIARNEREGFSLWTLNNNVPYLYEHSMIEGEKAEGAEETVTFRHNDPEDKSKFREEISLDFWATGEVTYRYSWGMPNGEFADRSGVRMKKV